MHLNTPNSSDGTQTHVSLADSLIQEPSDLKVNNSSIKYYNTVNSDESTWPMTWYLVHDTCRGIVNVSTCGDPTHPLPRQGVQGGEVGRTV